MIRRAVIGVIAAVAFTAAMAVFFVALYHWLRRDFLPEEALAVIAGTLLLVGLVLLAIARRPRIPARPAAASDDVLSPLLARLVGDHPLGAALSAATLGFLFESRPELGRTLVDLLRRR